MASFWLSPSTLSSDGSITNSPFHIIPPLQSAVHSRAHSCVADGDLERGPVNNRPWDSSPLSGASSVWKPFFHVDAERQEVLWGGGCVPFSLWTGSKCSSELLHSILRLLLRPAYSPDQQWAAMTLFSKASSGCWDQFYAVLLVVTLCL